MVLQHVVLYADVMKKKRTEFDKVVDEEDETSMFLTSAEFVVEASSEVRRSRIEIFNIHII